MACSRLRLALLHPPGWWAQLPSETCPMVKRAMDLGDRRSVVPEHSTGGPALPVGQSLPLPLVEVFLQWSL